jgi:membrane-associated phospholipid phosphatase
MLPVLWWRLSWKLGVRLFVALVVSVYVNALLKEIIALPRPFLHAEIASLRPPDDYSFPSDHVQSAMVFWELLVLKFRRRWFTLALPLPYLGLRRLSPGTESVYYPLHLWTLFAAIGL